MRSAGVPFLVLAAVASVVPASSIQAKVTDTFRDPVPYCHALKTIDGPDKRYEGPAVPGWIFRKLGARKDAPGYVAWRCEAGLTLACINGGITGPCDKIDMNAIPSADMRQWCRTQPNSDPPAAITGHYTAFDWYCAGRQPAIRRQLVIPTYRGFRAEDWRVVAE